MKKYFLICAAICLPFVLKAQKTKDTVAEKIARLPYFRCEIAPRPLVKDGRLPEYFDEHFIRPASLTGKFEDEVVVAVLIDSLGNLEKTQFIKNLSPNINREALRVLSTINWKPGINNFKPSKYNLVLRVIISNYRNENHYEVGALAIHVDPPRETIPENEFRMANKLPNFPGGVSAFFDFVDKNIIYPKKARKNGTHGNVHASCMVEKDGSLTDLFISDSPDDELSLEALRVLKLCPKFEPAILNGVPVQFRYDLMLKFEIK